MAKSGRVRVKLRSPVSHFMYVTTKHPQRMETRKYDPNVKQHVVLPESK